MKPCLVSVPVPQTCPNGAPLSTVSQAGNIVSNFEIGVSELCHKTLDCFGAHPIFPARMFCVTGESAILAVLIFLFKALAISVAATAPFVAVATDCGPKNPAIPISPTGLTKTVSPFSSSSCTSFPFKKSPILWYNFLAGATHGASYTCLVVP